MCNLGKSCIDPSSSQVLFTLNSKNNHYSQIKLLKSYIQTKNLSLSILKLDQFIKTVLHSHDMNIVKNVIKNSTRIVKRNCGYCYQSTYYLFDSIGLLFAQNFLTTDILKLYLKSIKEEILYFTVFSPNF